MLGVRLGESLHATRQLIPADGGDSVDGGRCHWVRIEALQLVAHNRCSRCARENASCWRDRWR